MSKTLPVSTRIPVLLPVWNQSKFPVAYWNTHCSFAFTHLSYPFSHFLLPFLFLPSPFLSFSFFFFSFLFLSFPLFVSVIPTTSNSHPGRTIFWNRSRFETNGPWGRDTRSTWLSLSLSPSFSLLELLPRQRESTDPGYSKNDSCHDKTVLGSAEISPRENPYTEISLGSKEIERYLGGERSSSSILIAVIGLLRNVRELLRPEYLRLLVSYWKSWRKFFFVPRILRKGFVEGGESFLMSCLDYAEIRIN